jgi:hypothetical protein
MSIKTSVYDFFSYMIPGIFYLLIFIYLGNIFELLTINAEFLTFSSIQILAYVAIISYVIGHIFEPLSTIVWYRFFRPKEDTLKDEAEVIFAQFKKEHPRFEFAFEPIEFPIIKEYIRQKCITALDDIEQFSALYMMLKSISLSFLIFALIMFVRLLTSYHSLTHHILYLVIGCASLVFSIITIKRSVTFRKWYYFRILESIVSDTLDSSEIVKKV